MIIKNRWLSSHTRENNTEIANTFNNNTEIANTLKSIEKDLVTWTKVTFGKVDERVNTTRAELEKIIGIFPLVRIELQRN